MEQVMIEAIVGHITYKPGWMVKYTKPKGSKGYIQVTCNAGVCVQTGLPDAWRGAKHYVSKHMCRQEIVGLCFKAFVDAEMHECREWFAYGTRAIYSPHLDPDALWRLCAKADNFNVRKNAMSMEEGEP